MIGNCQTKGSFFEKLTLFLTNYIVILEFSGIPENFSRIPGKFPFLGIEIGKIVSPKSCVCTYVHVLR